MRATLLLAFSAGMVAAINPCGFALLPAYLSYYLGLESRTTDQPTSGTASSAGRALVVSAAMTAGFMVVFGALGSVWSSLSSTLGERLPWAVVALGVAMIIGGIAMIAGYTPVVNGPKLRSKSGNATAWSAFVFGITYGVASLSCTIPTFIAVLTATSRRHGFLSGLGAFLLYGLGMGAIITVLTLAVSFARAGLITRLRSLVPHMSRVSGGLLIVSGIIAIVYGWYEAQILVNGREPSFAAGSVMADWQQSISSWISSVGEERLGLAIAIVVLGALATTAVLRRSKQSDSPSSEMSSEPSSEPPDGPSEPQQDAEDQPTTDAR